MPKANHGGQAFPSHPILYGSADAGQAQGMTLRDWFAGQALPAVVEGVCNRHFTLGDENPPALIATKAYEIADAMLAAREGGAS